MLAELRNKLVAVKQNQLTKETVLKVLSHFSLFFDRMTPADKQVLLRSLVEEIQIFPAKTEDGRIFKSIKLFVPVVYENETTPKISWDKLTPVETGAHAGTRPLLFEIKSAIQVIIPVSGNEP